MVHGRILVLVILAAASHLVMPNGDGPPLGACESMMPNHDGASAQNVTSPFEIEVNENTIKSGDNTGVTVTVKVTADAPTGTNFEGVFVQARVYKGSSNKAIGSFKLVSGEIQLKTLDCTNSKGAVSHKNKEGKTSKSFNWIPPTTSSDLEVRFRGTFVQQKTKFWVDIFSDKVTVTGGAAKVMASTLTALVLALTSIVLL